MADTTAPQPPSGAALDRAAVAAVLRDAAAVIESPAGSADVLRAAQAGRDALDAVRVAGLADLHASGAYEDEGASSVTTWMRRELRLDAGETGALRRAASVAAVLPSAGRAAEAGRLRLEHLRVLAYGIKHVGTEAMSAAEEVLVEHATTHEPASLLRLVRSIRARLFPDDLDEAWARGMDREDLRLTACGEGFHVTGFLGATTGAALKAILDNLTVPRTEADPRSASQRRVDGLAGLLTGILDAGVLPADRGVRPHVTVVIPADVYDGAVARAGGPRARTSTHGRDPHGSGDADTGVAELTGFGAVGPALAGYLTCLGETTPVVTAGAAAGSGVLDVGRTRRVATLRQRRAIETHQDGVCATPACGLPVEEVHHLTWWSAGGATDLDNLIGLCAPCHRLVHRGRLVITVRPATDTSAASDASAATSLTGSRGSLRSHLDRREEALRVAWADLPTFRPAFRPRPAPKPPPAPAPHERPHVRTGLSYVFTNRHGQPVQRRAGSVIIVGPAPRARPHRRE